MIEGYSSAESWHNIDHFIGDCLMPAIAEFGYSYREVQDAEEVQIRAAVTTERSQEAHKLISAVKTRAGSLIQVECEEFQIPQTLENEPIRHRSRSG